MNLDPQEFLSIALQAGYKGEEAFDWGKKFYQSRAKEVERETKVVDLFLLLLANGYTDLRRLDDGNIIGVLKMLFTYRVCVCLDETGHSGGVDFPTYEMAANFARTMKTYDEMPPLGWTALKRRCDYELGRDEHPEKTNA